MVVSSAWNRDINYRACVMHKAGILAKSAKEYISQG